MNEFVVQEVRRILSIFAFLGMAVMMIIINDASDPKSEPCGNHYEMRQENTLDVKTPLDISE